MGRDYRLGEVPAEYGPTGEARHAVEASIAISEDSKKELKCRRCHPQVAFQCGTVLDVGFELSH